MLQVILYMVRTKMSRAEQPNALQHPKEGGSSIEESVESF